MKKICKPTSLIFLFLLGIIIFRPIRTLYSEHGSVLERGFSQTIPHYKNLYYRSQYVQKDNPSIIPDQALESFAGAVFLSGLSPILIVHDQPPLGRYIIALSIYLFDNPATLPTFILLLGGYGVFMLSVSILKNPFAALIPFGMFVNEPLYLNSLRVQPLLEPLQFSFIVFAFYSFIKAAGSARSTTWYVITSLLIGCVISIRFFVVGGVLTAGFLTYLALYRYWKKMVQFMFTLPLSVIVLVLSYTRTMQSGYSLRQIMGIQKYIFVYHSSALVNPLSFWDLFMFNKWHTWWGKNAISSDPQWVVIWPLSLLVIVVFSVLRMKKNDKWSKETPVLLIWICLYCSMLSLGYTSTRYFLPFIPFLYIIAVDSISRTIDIHCFRDDILISCHRKRSTIQ